MSRGLSLSTTVLLPPSIFSYIRILPSTHLTLTSCVPCFPDHFLSVISPPVIALCPTGLEVQCNLSMQRLKRCLLTSSHFYTYVLFQCLSVSNLFYFHHSYWAHAVHFTNFKTHFDYKMHLSVLFGEREKTAPSHKYNEKRIPFFENQEVNVTCISGPRGIHNRISVLYVKTWWSPIVTLFSISYV